MKGKIVKGIGGFYYVDTASGLVQTRGRGIFRKQGLTPFVGDDVDIEIPENGDGVIREILERRNSFLRPPVANLDCIITVFSPAKPKPDFGLVDKLLIMAESKGIEPILCMNKIDLISEKQADEMLSPYSAHYDVFKVSAVTGYGVDKLKECISGRNTALAGSSGVGKSSITNLLIPEADMETSEISKRTGRGRHTTRHVELFKLPEGGYLYDTPGFTSFDLTGIEAKDLSKFYPEILSLEAECRFDDCSHTHEPGCRVLKALRDGNLNPLRYQSYVRTYRELLERSKW